MRLIDLTLEIQGPGREGGVARVEERHRAGGGTRYTSRVYHFAHDSMAGTYIDFPGHIQETDDGQDSASVPIERLFRVDASVIHLDREDGSGGVSAEALQRACAGPVEGGALIINALGGRRFDEVVFRSVYLEKEAVRWIIDTGVHLLISDIYESQALHGVFYDLFGAGVSTVCCPVNLHLLTAPHGKVTVLPLRVSGVTQLPCRVIAEWE